MFLTKNIPNNSNLFFVNSPKYFKIVSRTSVSTEPHVQNAYKIRQVPFFLIALYNNNVTRTIISFNCCLLYQVRVLDLNEPTKRGQKKDSEISIGLPTYQGGSQIIKFPEVIVVKVPHYVIVKESDFINNRHYDIPSISGMLYFVFY